MPNMSGFICPVCGGRLADCGTLLRCEGNHCFDKSKFGYVNLLLSQSSGAKRHGDDRVMVRSRRDFLNAGYYSFLRDEVCAVCRELLPPDTVILDAGCGEGYYTAGVKAALPSAQVLGVDISKDALEYFSKRKCGAETAVAGVFSLPVASGECDCVLNIFSPEADDEFRRVLKDGGVLIRVIPAEDHLFSLKQLVYDKPYRNEMPEPQLDGFELVDERRISAELELADNAAVLALFKMTPYYYKTGRADQQKLDGVDRLVTQAEFCVRVYRKEEHHA